MDAFLLKFPLIRDLRVNTEIATFNPLTPLSRGNASVLSKLNSFIKLALNLRHATPIRSMTVKNMIRYLSIWLLTVL